MKTISSKNAAVRIVSLALVLAVLPVSPSMAIATTTNGNGAGSAGGTSAACLHVATIEASNNNTVAAHMAAMQADFATRLSTIASNQSLTDQKVATARADATAQFEAKVKALEAQAGLTQVQLQAIATYKTSMEQAEATREAAIDSARTAYRTALNSDVTNNQQALTGAVSAYQATIKNAFGVAATNCGDGTAITTLRATVKTARQALTTARQSDKVTATLKQLAVTRDTAFKAANATFTASAQAYTATLVAALSPTK